MNKKLTACVTGGTGMIGRRIAQRLILDGYKVRVLSRNKFDAVDRHAELYNGDIEDEALIEQFVAGAELVFHCAAELNNEARMWDVNVLGTERIVRASQKAGVHYFCFISSAGVIGQTDRKWVDEDTPCNPRNIYEKSKWAAEQIVARGINGCKIIILRPVNVIDESKPGALSLAISDSFISHLKVVLKGAECAHIVHAENVSEAALYFISRPYEGPQCYFVSCDNEPLNTFAGLRGLSIAIRKKKLLQPVRPVYHFPLIVPFIVRQIVRGAGNKGDVRYSPEKLLSEGFRYPIDVKKAVTMVLAAKDQKQL